MHRLFNIIAQTLPPESQAAVSTEPVPFWDPSSVLLLTIGLCVGIIWLFWCGGFGSLRTAPIRRCRRWFVYWPLPILIAWIVGMLLIQAAVTAVFGSCSQSFQEMISYPANAVLEIGLIAGMIWVARKSFVRGLKGFGLNSKKIMRDIPWAVVNLLGTFPLILMGLWATLMLGHLFKGPDFSLEVHQSLEMLDTAGVTLKVLIVIFAAVIVPVFEEMLFRGFFQTSLHVLSGKRWVGIVTTSLFFAVLHPPTHVPALFLLSCGLGYAYERSGSLHRPILMHVLFNGLSVSMALFAAP